MVTRDWDWSLSGCRERWVRAWRIASLLAPWRSSQLLRLPRRPRRWPGAGARGDVVVLEALRLVRCPLRWRGGRVDRRTASRPGSSPACSAQPPSSPRNAGHVHTETAQCLGRDAVIGLRRARQAGAPNRGRGSAAPRRGVGPRRSIPGFLGEVVEIHCVSLGLLAVGPADVGAGSPGSRSRLAWDSPYVRQAVFNCHRHSGGRLRLLGLDSRIRFGRSGAGTPRCLALPSLQPGRASRP